MSDMMTVVAHVTLSVEASHMDRGAAALVVSVAKSRYTAELDAEQAMALAALLRRKGAAGARGAVGVWHESGDDVVHLYVAEMEVRLTEEEAARVAADLDEMATDLLVRIYLGNREVSE